MTKKAGINWPFLPRKSRPTASYYWWVLASCILFPHSPPPPWCHTLVTLTLVTWEERGIRVWGASIILIRPCPWTFMYIIWWSFFVLYSSTFHWPYTLTSPHQLEDFQFPLLFQPVRSYISRVIGVVTSDKWWTLLGFCYQRGRTSLCAQSTCIIQSWSWPNLYLCSCQSTLRPTI